MDAKKKLLILILCTVFLTIELILLAGFGFGIWLGTRELPAVAPTVATTTQPQPTTPSEFLIRIDSAIQTGQAFTNGYIELDLSLPNGIMTQGNVLVYLDGVERISYKMFPSNLRIPTRRIQDGTHKITVVAVSTRNANGVGEIIILVQDPGFMLVSITFKSI